MRASRRRAALASALSSAATLRETPALERSQALLPCGQGGLDLRCQFPKAHGGLLGAAMGLGGGLRAGRGGRHRGDGEDRRSGQGADKGKTGHPGSLDAPGLALTPSSRTCRQNDRQTIDSVGKCRGLGVRGHAGAARVGGMRRWLFADQLGPHFLDEPDQPVLLIEARSVFRPPALPPAQGAPGPVRAAPPRRRAGRAVRCSSRPTPTREALAGIGEPLSVCQPDLVRALIGSSARSAGRRCCPRGGS